MKIHWRKYFLIQSVRITFFFCSCDFPIFYFDPFVYRSCESSFCFLLLFFLSFFFPPFQIVLWVVIWIRVFFKNKNYSMVNFFDYERIKKKDRFDQLQRHWAISCFFSSLCSNFLNITKSSIIPVLSAKELIRPMITPDFLP